MQVFARSIFFDTKKKQIIILSAKIVDLRNNFFSFMKISQIKIILWPVILILIYFVYNSVRSEMDFNKNSGLRISENIQKLKDLRKLQMEYESANGFYANNFESLMSFFENDSIGIVKLIWDQEKEKKFFEKGESDDLTDADAIEMGILIADTILISAKELTFNDSYMKTRDNKYPLDVNKLSTIPFTSKMYNIESGTINKGNVMVQVFEISANYQDIFTGLPIKNRKGLERLLKVGSMTEASLNGNWGE